jgi:predicted nuclease of predicted toxin-antitoxin system
MKIWVNAQLPPAVAKWIQDEFLVEAIAVRDLGFREALDKDIFEAAREAAAIVMTKDSDFVDLVNSRGAPPQVLWLTCGNTSNERLREILGKTLPQALKLLESGEKIVEVTDD